jgi:D-alanine-D-alanine ligase
MTQPLADQHIVVLLGGPSAEREVSLVTGAACAEALERLGARVSRVDPGPDIAQVLTALKPDLVFNGLHGRWGEDGCVQGVLETLGLAYTHSGVLASALAMDKARSKAVLAAAGIPVPGGGLFSRHDVARDHVMQPPYVVKPNAEGSSVGVFIVPEGANAPPRELAAPDWAFGDQVLVEPFVPGVELSVAVLGRATGPRPWRSPKSARPQVFMTTTPSTRRRFDPRPAGPDSGRHKGSGPAHRQAWPYNSWLPRCDSSRLPL